IAGTATQVSAHSLSDLRGRQIGEGERLGHIGCRGAWRAGACLFDHRYRGHDLARSAETALEAVMFDEGRLNGMERPVAFESLDSCDSLAFLHESKCHAGQNAPPLDNHRAGTAFTPIARFLGSCQMQLL